MDYPQVACKITLGEFLVLSRKRLRLSQAMLAASAGISRNYLGLIERDRAPNISCDIIHRLAFALGMREHWTFTRMNQDRVELSDQAGLATEVSLQPGGTP